MKYTKDITVQVVGIAVDAVVPFFVFGDGRGVATFGAVLVVVAFVNPDADELTISSVSRTHVA